MPFPERRLRIDQRPDQMARDEHVVAFGLFQGALGIAHDVADIRAAPRGLRPRLAQHRLRPVETGDVETEAVQQMRDHARAAGEIERPTALAGAEMAPEKIPPGLALLL